MIRLLSYLLWLANSYVPDVGRDRFYAVKRRLLERWGTRDGEDLQEVTKTCWSCDGTGEDHRTGESCSRCSGGVYDRFWCVLTRWRLGGRIFHTPGARLSRQPGQVTIHGVIRHDPHPAAIEAWLWLCLVFDTRFFPRAMTGSCRCAWTWYPLTNLQRVLFWTWMYLTRWKPRTCYRCGRLFIRPFEAGVWYVCRRCDRALWWRQATDEVPF